MFYSNSSAQGRQAERRLYNQTELSPLKSLATEGCKFSDQKQTEVYQTKKSVT